MRTGFASPNSSVTVALDFASYIVTSLMVNQLTNATERLTMLRYNVSLRLFNIQPVYGSADREFLGFMAPVRFFVV